MRFLTNPSTDPWYNLSFDEYCLEQYPSDDSFFYLWRNRPSVIVGLNQNVYTEVNLDYLDAHGICLARRSTGGGAVYHDLQNLNYTFVGREVSPAPVVEALQRLGVRAELSGRNDIFVDGRKVSGYARRVWRDRELIHGTLMYDVDLDTLTHVLDVPGSKLTAKGVASVRSRVANLKTFLPGLPSIDALQTALQEILAGRDAELPFGAEQKAAVQRQREEKYATWAWNYGQSRTASLVRRAALPCGRVEAHLEVDRGRITSVRFAGDFLGDWPVEELEEQLTGVRFERNALRESLDAAWVDQYFDGTAAEDLLGLLLGA
ncbi:MAG: lipoate--protein ligase [Bacteroidales bacterium]|jgi:lipoate-protein ligase A|nr:lipoate--protein ligase [Bacteroidales bacterium]